MPGCRNYLHSRKGTALEPTLGGHPISWRWCGTAEVDSGVRITQTIKLFSGNQTCHPLSHRFLLAGGRGNTLPVSAALPKSTPSLARAPSSSKPMCLTHSPPMWPAGRGRTYLTTKAFCGPKAVTLPTAPLSSKLTGIPPAAARLPAPAPHQLSSETSTRAPSFHPRHMAREACCKDPDVLPAPACLKTMACRAKFTLTKTWKACPNLAPAYPGQPHLHGFALAVLCPSHLFIKLPLNI